MKTVGQKASTKAGRVSGSKINPNAKIKLLVKANPKHPGSGVAVLFNLYRTGMTAAAYVNAVRSQSVRKSAGWVALKWDLERKYIALS